MRHSHARTSALALLLLAMLAIFAACGAAPPAPPAPVSAAPTASAGDAPTQPPPTAPAATPAPAETSPAPAPAAPRVLRLGSGAITGWPENLDPQKAGNVGEAAVLALTYEGLARLSPNLETIPGAAERWAYSTDATSLTFTLRDGLVASDGMPITSADFRSAIERVLDPRVPGFFQTSLNTLVGADAVVATEVPTDAAQLDARFAALGIDTPDERTITFRFTEPTPYFHTLLAGPISAPVRRELVERGGETWYTDAANHIGNGPFQIVSIDRTQSVITLRANERYWQGRPALDGLELRVIPDLAVALQAYKSGELDIVTLDANDVPAILADPALKAEFVEHPGSCVFTQSFNVQRPPFDNLLVRQAFAYAFDRDAFLRDAYQGVAVKNLTWAPPGYPAHDPDERRFDYDLTKARELLAQAGYPGGAGFPEISYTYTTDNPADKARVEYFAEMMRQNLGVTVRPDPVDSGTLYGMYGDADALPAISEGGWCGGADPHDWLSLAWHSRSFYAQAFVYQNPEVDRLLDAADRTVDQAERMRLYREAQRAIVGDVPALFYRATKNLYLVRPGVKGMVFSAPDVFGGETSGLLGVMVEP